MVHVSNINIRQLSLINYPMILSNVFALNAALLLILIGAWAVCSITFSCDDALTSPPFRTEGTTPKTISMPNAKTVTIVDATGFRAIAVFTYLTPKEV